jgi:hypothetical protein
MNCVQSKGKAEKGKFTGSEATTRFPRASCFKKPTRSVPETWGRMCVCGLDLQLGWAALITGCQLQG